MLLLLPLLALLTMLALQLARLVPLLLLASLQKNVIVCSNRKSVLLAHIDLAFFWQANGIFVWYRY